MTFESLGLAPDLVQAVKACGYTAPTPIQEQAIPHLLTGRDLMGCAQTGTGKTAAFALPILHMIRGTEPGKLRALILVPTRELAIQVGRNIREYSEGSSVRSTAVYGGVPIGPQEMMLRHGVDILVATPGRLKDHMWRGLIDFRETRFLVLDEADRMLDMGFIDAVREIVELIPQDRQTLLFSATLEPAILKLARNILRDPVRVQVDPTSSAAEGVEHRMVNVRPGEKVLTLNNLIHDDRMGRTLVFTRTKRGAHRLSLQLKQQGHRATSIHSDKSQSQRVAALEAFRDGKVDILVATDIAARGLDVAGISHVVNFDLPHSAEDYVHRIGRTARAGHKGIAISLVTPEDRGGVRSIEQLIGQTLTDGTHHGEGARQPRPELVRQRSPRQDSAPRDSYREESAAVLVAAGPARGPIRSSEHSRRTQRSRIDPQDRTSPHDRRSAEPRSSQSRRSTSDVSEREFDAIPSRVARSSTARSSTGRSSAVRGSASTRGREVTRRAPDRRADLVVHAHRDRDARPARDGRSGREETPKKGGLLRRVFSQIGVQFAH